VDVLLYWAAGIVTVGGAMALLWRGVSALVRSGKKWDMFLEDWHGTEARPGRPAVPGIMQRMVDLEAGLLEIRHEVFPNSGGSLRDAVDRLEGQFREVTLIPTQRSGDSALTGR
jgi:hypothetical protein